MAIKRDTGMLLGDVSDELWMLWRSQGRLAGAAGTSKRWTVEPGMMKPLCLGVGTSEALLQLLIEVYHPFHCRLRTGEFPIKRTSSFRRDILLSHKVILPGYHIVIPNPTAKCLCVGPYAIDMDAKGQ